MAVPKAHTKVPDAPEVPKGQSAPGKAPVEPALKAPALAAVKKERKKPVRKSPALKDFPNRLAWLKAMTEYELSQSDVENQLKVARIDLRIAAKRKAIDVLTKEIGVLQCERNVLDPVQDEPDDTVGEPIEEAKPEAEAEAEPEVTGGAPETPVP